MQKMVQINYNNIIVVTLLPCFTHSPVVTSRDSRYVTSKTSDVRGFAPSEDVENSRKTSASAAGCRSPAPVTIIGAGDHLSYILQLNQCATYTDLQLQLHGFLSGGRVTLSNWPLVFYGYVALDLKEFMWVIQ